MSSWERGYGDMRAASPTWRRCGRCPGRRARWSCLADVAWLDGSDVVASPRQVLRRQLARLAERGWTAQRRHRARVHGLPRHLRGGLAQGLPRPAPGQPLQRRLLAAGHRPRRAADPPHPQQHGRGRDGRSRTPRASATSASTRSTSATPTRCAPPTSTRSTRTAPRRSPRERAWRSPSWRSSTSARATRATSTSRSPTPRGRCSRATRRCFDAFLAGQLACLREMTLLLAPNVNSYKRYARRQRSRRRRSPGGTTTAPARCAWSATAPGCASRTASAAPTSTPTWRSSAIIAAGLHGVDAGAGARAGVRGQRLCRGPELPRLPATLRDARELFAASDGGPRRVRRGGRRALPQRRRRRARGVRQSAVTDWERVRGFERL